MEIRAYSHVFHAKEQREMLASPLMSDRSKNKRFNTAIGTTYLLDISSQSRLCRPRTNFQDFGHSSLVLSNLRSDAVVVWLLKANGPLARPAVLPDVYPPVSGAGRLHNHAHKFEKNCLARQWSHPEAERACSRGRQSMYQKARQQDPHVQTCHLA